MPGTLEEICGVVWEGLSNKRTLKPDLKEVKEPTMQLSGEKSILSSQCKIPEVSAVLMHLRKNKEDFADGAEGPRRGCQKGSK